MGNHQVGQAMAQAAKLALEMRTNQTALELLDKICEPYRNTDAEFENSTDISEPLGKLMAEAFSPGVDWDLLYQEAHDDQDKIDEISDKWYIEVDEKFDERYEFW